MAAGTGVINQSINQQIISPTMHQDHNIPWNTLSSHFKFRDNHQVTPHRTDLWPLQKPTQAKDFTYFAKALTKTIEEFAATEREKYPPTFPTPSEGNVFSDDLLKRYPNSYPSSPFYHADLLDVDNQRIERWIARARPADDASGSTLAYGYQLDLADVVKVLIAENEMETLLMFANHPQIPINGLWNMGWG